MPPRSPWRTILFAGTLAACILTPRLYEIGPQSEYRKWWAEAERCIGAKGDFNQVRWLVDRSNDGLWFLCGRVDQCVGLWSTPNRITIAAQYLHHETVVKHEMLHALLQPGNHDSERFKTCSREL